MARSWLRVFGLPLTLSLLLPSNSEAGGPSFDCAKARTWSEQQVCQDAGLASLDREMAELYSTVRREGSRRFDEQKAGQRAWLKQREQCQQAADQKTCLVEHYQQRMAALMDNGGTTQTSVRQPALTPAVVWNHSDMIYRQCEIPDFECVLRLMKSSGASPEAMAFLKKEEAWVVDFTEYGNTNLLLLETFRANTNHFYALASQAAGVIHAEGYNFSQQDKQRPQVKAVLSAHPQAFFIAKPSFIHHEPGSNGGSRFVFSDAVAECRACEFLATGELVYEFDAAGRYLGVRLGDFRAENGG